MKPKRSKVYKIKNQDMREDTAFERNFRVGIAKYGSQKRDEKIILTIGIVTMFLVALFARSDVARTFGTVITFLLGLAGILL